MTWFHHKNGKIDFYWCIEDEVADTLIVSYSTAENESEVDDPTWKGIIRCYRHENEDLNWEKLDSFTASDIVDCRLTEMNEIENENMVLKNLIMRGIRFGISV